MSAPDTNVKTQQKRHRPSLLGIGSAVALAFIGITMLLVWLFAVGDTPDGAEVQIDGRTGETVVTD